MFVDKGLTTAQISAFNETLQFVSEYLINIESHGADGNIGGLSLGNVYNILGLQNKGSYIYTKSIISLNIVHIFLKSDDEAASIRANTVSFKNSLGQEYLLIAKDTMKANIHVLDLKGTQSLF